MEGKTVGNTLRVILVGKSGSGKSSLANTIYGEKLFELGHFNKSNTSLSHSEMRSVHGRLLTLIDTPGLLDPGRSEENTRQALLSCVTESAPGPHAVLIVLKAEKFTEQEKAVVAQVRELFPGNVLEHAVVVFTCGDQLPEGMTVKDFAGANKSLSDLVEECGGRCHVVDNKYWKNNQQEDEYRSNRFQVAELLRSIDQVVAAHGGGHYTNDMFDEVEREIQKEDIGVRKSAGSMSERAIREEAKGRVFKRRVGGPKSTWLPKLLFVGGVAILAIVTALLVKRKFVKQPSLYSPVAPPPLATVEEALVNADPTPTLPEPQKSFEVILDELYDLYERTFDPWNLFE